MKNFLLFASVLIVAVSGPPAMAQSEVFASNQLRQSLRKVNYTQSVQLHVLLKELEKKYGVSFLYNAKLKNILVPSTWDQRDQNIALVLDKLFSGTELYYRMVEDNFYVIISKHEVEQTTYDTLTLNSPLGSSPVDELFLESTIASGLFATLERTISGTVINDENEPMPGVNVLVKNTTTGTVTDADGKYKLLVPDNATTLVFSFIGYTPKEVAINSQTVVDVKLDADIKQLQEVVVIGYGEVKKADVTGAVSHVGETELKTVVKTSIDQALQGRVAGVVVTNNSGQPGGGVSLRVRGASSISGTNEPLYVIDGVPMEGQADGTASGFDWAGGGNGQTAVSKLATINPDDIVSIDVLKDASAQAIYGSRAANGVVLITTKRGKAGESKITYDGYTGVQQLGKTLDVLNLQQYAQYVNDNYEATGRTPKPPEFAAPEFLGSGTNWQQELFQNAVIQNHQVGLSGGNEKNTYALSTGYFQQEGIVIGTDFERYSVRLNLDSKVKEWFKVGNSFAFSYSDQKMTLTDQDDGVVSIALTQSPEIPVKNTDGSWAGITSNRSDFTNGENPVAKAHDRNLNLKRYKAIGNFFFDLTFLKDFTFRTELGGDIEFGNNYAFIPTYEYGPYAKNDINQSKRDRNQSIYWILKNYLTYSHTFKQHHQITAMAGHEAQSSTFEYVSAIRSKFPSNQIHEIGAGDASTARNGGDKNDWGLESYFGRVMYTFSDKYYFTGTMRADASSNFGQNYKWGYFPSFAVKWRMLSESFLSNVKQLTELSVRAGYGLTGNQAIPSYQYGSALGTGLNGFGSVTYLDKISNPNIRWEASKQFNVGIDTRFLNDRIELIADYYIKTTDNQLTVLSLPDYVGTNGTGGYSAPWVNLGEVENRGIELTLNTHNIDRALKWNTAVIFSANRNKVIDLGEGIAPIDGYAQWVNLVTRTQAGQPIGMFYGYVVDGIFTSAEQLEAAPQQGRGDISRTAGTWLGDYRFKNLNDDNVIDAKDRTFIGNPQPKFTYGLNNTFAFKNIDLSIYVQGTYGNDIYNFLRARTESMRFLRDNQTTAVLRSAKLQMIDPAGDPDNVANWMVLNPNTDMPRQIAGDPNENTRMSNRYIEDGSYLRIQNVTLGYTLPPKFMKNYVKRFRVYGSVQNLHTFTKYNGYDPEIGAYNQDPKLTGVDNGRYPVPRTITFGLNLEF